MAHRTDPTTLEGLREYLRVCYRVTDQQISEALENVEANFEEYKSAIALGSFVDYPGDKIADRQGWTLDEDAYNEHYDPDEEYD